MIPVQVSPSSLWLPSITTRTVEPGRYGSSPQTQSRISVVTRSSKIHPFIVAVKTKDSWIDPSCTSYFLPLTLSLFTVLLVGPPITRFDLSLFGTSSVVLLSDSSFLVWILHSNRRNNGYPTHDSHSFLCSLVLVSETPVHVQVLVVTNVQYLGTS